MPLFPKPFSPETKPMKVSVTVWRGREETWIGESGLPLEVGRQSRGEDDRVLRKVQDHGNQFRVAIAEITVLGLPRHALRIEETGDGKLRCKNMHSQSTFHLTGQPGPVLPGSDAVAESEFVILLPEDLTVRVSVVTEQVEAVEDHDHLAATTPFRTIARDAVSSDGDLGDFTLPINPAKSFVRTLANDSSVNRGEAVVDLVRQALAVVKKSAGSDEFFETAVNSVARMIELDRAYVLLHDGDVNQWSVRAHFIEREQRQVPSHTIGEPGAIGGPGAVGQPGQHFGKKHVTESSSDTDVRRSGDNEQPKPKPGNTPMPSGSRVLLQQVLKDRKTLIYEPESYQHTVGASIMMLDRAVAAPLFNEQGDVIGALYGDRTIGSSHADTPIGDLEATLLEVMAGAVSAGIVRQRHEAIQSSMTQFFSPAVTQRLVQNEDLLSGRDAEVSILFCDIRGFSTISERVGPEKTIQWINDVFTKLSLCVVRTDGVLVNYIGDELVAMWGAPAEQPDHAKRACEAACQMLQQIEPLRQHWSEITPQKFGVGIGIHTGVARVGNTGSKVKFQYGPLGNTVNLASRVQNITKKFGITAIVTQSTRDALEQIPVESPSVAPESTCISELQTRRLATVRPVGMTETVNLFQLQTGDDPNWKSMAERYESALQLYCDSDLTGAARVLASLVHEFPEDTPSVVLLGRVVDAITNRVDNVNPVMEFTTK